MVYLSQTVQFVPCWIKGENDGEVEKRANRVTGKVIFANYQNECFTVEYSCGGTMQRESFKFSQIGKEIHIVRGGKHGS